VYASQAKLSCQRNGNVLREKKISYVSGENIRWLDPHIATATADVVLAVEKNTKNTRRMAIASFCTFWPPLNTPLRQSQ